MGSDRMPIWTARAMAWTASAVLLVACAGNHDQPLSSEVFYSPPESSTAHPDGSGQPVDEPGAVSPRQEPKTPDQSNEEPLEQIAPVITENVKTPAESAPQGS